MRVAFVGKGGAGKSSLAGTFARVLTETRDRVLALDSDPMPGLAFSLGVPHVDTGLPDDVVEEDAVDGRRFRLAGGRSGTEVVEQHATRTTDGVYFLQLGKARGPRWENTRHSASSACSTIFRARDGASSATCPVAPGNPS
jgi:CO dehydrogenase maturation factor